jgi:hypothetical protein
MFIPPFIFWFEVALNHQGLLALTTLRNYGVIPHQRRQASFFVRKEFDEHVD